MGRLHLEYARLSIAVDGPAALEPALRANFMPGLTSPPTAPPDCVYAVTALDPGYSLTRDGAVLGACESVDALLIELESDLERALLDRLDTWVGLHGGATVIDDRAIVVVGHSDAGKTTSTFQLVELGLDLLSEEVTPVDPATRLVHPFPQVLSLSRRYVEAWARDHHLQRGTVHMVDEGLARYATPHYRTTPARLGALAFPAYDPDGPSALIEVAPNDVMPEILHYCFQPHTSDEALYDSVITLVNGCRLFRVRTTSVTSARGELTRLIAALA